MTEIKPLVSIGLPVYNCEEQLQAALDSLLAQDYEDFELIISDNASTDNTSALCQVYLQRDKRIIYYRNETNKGRIYNFNRVLELARGKYFMWAAHDDRWEASFISNLIYKLEKNPKYVLAFSRFDILGNNWQWGSIIDRNWSEYFDRGRLLRMLNMILVHYNTQKACFLYGVIKKDYLLKCSGYYSLYQDENHGNDVITLFRLLSCGPFAFADKLLFHYNFREAPASQRLRQADITKLAIKNRFLIKIIKALEQFRINLLYRPLNYAYYRGLRGVVKTAEITFLEKILLIIAVGIEECFEPSKLKNILSWYFIAFFRKIRKIIQIFKGSVFKIFL